MKSDITIDRKKKIGPGGPPICFTIAEDGRPQSIKVIFPRPLRKRHLAAVSKAVTEAVWNTLIALDILHETKR